MGAKLEKVVTDSWQQESVMLAAILDPRLKLSGFVTAEQKQMAVSLLKKYVEAYSGGIPSTREQPRSSVSAGSIHAAYIQRMCVNNAGESSEVDRYLGNSLEKADCQPLNYWKNHREDLPVLARVVIDFLAVCASSVESERWFSKGGKVITKFRASLENSTVQAAICLQSWYPCSFSTKVVSLEN